MMYSPSRQLLYLLLPLILIACGKEAPPPEAEGSYDRITSSGEYLPGFIGLYWSEEDGKLYLEIDQLEEPFIYVSSLSRGVGSNDLGLDRGQLGDTFLVRFSRYGPSVMLIADNPKYVARSDNPDERAAVEEAFAQSILWGFEVVASRDGRVLVDGTEFFLRDAHGVANRLKKAEEGKYAVDPKRSTVFLPRTRGFPDNTEVDAVVTLAGEPAGPIVSTVSPDALAITVHQHHSFVRLPEAGYTPLPYDPRAGFIDPSENELVYNYASAIGEPLRTAYAWRHRLHKKEPGAALSEAVEPIVYYVDRGAPEPIRSALMEGARWWNQAFEAAGYKNAFQVKLLPEGADPLDIRYNVIQWVHRSTRGWSYGYSVRDPRTQEILKGHVSLGSLRVRQDYLLAEGFTAPYVDDTVPDTLLEFALARIRQLAAHEVGHTLGLEHNFAASSNDRASVMDYPYPYVTLNAAGEIDLSDAYAVGIGAWDKRAVLWGYQDFPEGVNADSERRRTLQETYDSGLNFVADRHSRGDSYAVRAGPTHTRSALWDNGADPVAELDRTMILRTKVLAQFSERSIRMGRSMADIEDVLVPMYLVHRFQLQAAATVIGGREFTYALRGDGQTPTTPVTAQRQHQAINSLLATIVPAALRLRPELVAMIPPRAPGSGTSREIFPRQTGYIFDPHAAAATAAGLTLDTLLNSSRGARMNNNQADNAEQPGFQDLLQAVLQASWYHPPLGEADAQLQRVVNIAVLERLMLLAANGEAQTQVRAQAFDRIVELATWLGSTQENAPLDWRAHYRFAMEQIRRFREDPETMSPLVSVKAPPGSPI